MQERKKYKLFVSYSCEDWDLTRDFIKRLRTHNPEFEILFDQNPEHGNFNEVFRRQCSTDCNVGLLLVNASFIQSSYCQEIEVPILQTRAKREEIVLIPVLFQQCNYKEYNKVESMLFFQCKNGHLNNTRQEGANANEYNSKDANYEQTREEDKEQYHSLLSEWILACVSRTDWFVPKKFTPAASKNVQDAAVIEKTDNSKRSRKETQDILPSTNLADAIKNEEEMKDYFTTNGNLISNSISELIDLMDELDYEQSSFEDDLELTILNRATNLVNRLSPLLNLSEKSRLKIQFENLKENLALLKSSWQNMNNQYDAKKIQEDVIPKFKYTLEKVHKELKIDARLLN